LDGNENISDMRAYGVEEDDHVVDLGVLQFQVVDEDEEEAKAGLVVASAWCKVYCNGGATSAMAAVVCFVSRSGACREERQKVRSGGGKRE
jgi:hypothetical protein